MTFHKTEFAGAYLITPDRYEDERGFFARTWSAQEFRDQGLDTRIVQCGLSFNRLKGTLRGMHYQAEPFQQPKVVRCTMGAIYDVILDLRERSPTFRRWISVELSDENRNLLFVPAGCAHGFQTLCDRAEVFYHMGEVYSPQSERGVRWDDPLFGIQWPLEVSVISPRDAAYPDFQLAGNVGR